MSLAYKIYQSDYPYHIYNRTNNKEFLFEELDTVYPIFIDALSKTAKKTNFLCHHFVLMKNHFHLVGTTPDSNLALFMHNFQLKVSQSINKKLGRMNHLFGHRYGATVIQSIDYMAKIIQYVYLNPQVAGMVKNPFEYPFSTLKMYQNETLSQRETFKPDPLLESMTPNGRVSFLKDICYNFLNSEESEKIRKKLRSAKI